jgi:4-hydroxy-2-oxoheptanedioate aldolase
LKIRKNILMKPDHLIQKLRGGNNVYGTSIVSTSPVWSQAVSTVGLDFVFIDTEHLPIDRTELTFLCQTYQALGIAVLVRVPGPDPCYACMARDAGATGIVAPSVEKVEQVRELVGAVKYRPLKGARLHNVLLGRKELKPALKGYLEEYNRGSMCVIDIGSMAAVANLNALLKVQGLDAVIIGSHDLSINMGLPGQYEHPEFEKVVHGIIRHTREKGVAAGIHFPENAERQIKWMKEGVNIVLYSSDMFLFSQKLKEDMAKIKEAAGDTTLEYEDAYQKKLEE